MAGSRRPQFNLSERIRKARNEAGMEQDELAAQLHVARSTLSNWERGANRPHYVLLEKIATVTDVDLDWLLEGETPAVTRAVTAGQRRSHLTLLPSPALYVAQPYKAA